MVLPFGIDWQMLIFFLGVANDTTVLDCTVSGDIGSVSIPVSKTSIMHIKLLTELK